MTLSEMRQVLSEHGIQLTRSLGQNFLHDAHHLDRIVAAAKLTREEKVLEIGPGLGALTERLTVRAGLVLAIEKDVRLATVLAERFRIKPTFRRGAGPSNAEDPPPHPPEVAQGPEEPVHRGGTPCLQVLRADALEWLKREDRDWSGWKLVSNLPYSVASPILVELSQGNRSPQMMVVTLQLEVAERLMAVPDNKNYGVLTLLVQLDFEPVGWFKIPARSFFPQPNVDSACITLRRRPTLWLPEALRPIYVRIVKRGFSQRRKMMFKLLKQDWNADALEAAYHRLGLSSQVRAETVRLDQFVELTRCLTQGG